MAATTTTVHSAGPVAGSRSFLDRLRDGDEIARLVTFVFAAAVVLYHGFARVRTVDRLRSAAAQVRPEFLFHESLGSQLRRLRRAALHLWHAGHRRGLAVIAVPLGIGAAIFLAELAPASLRHPAFLIDLLAAVPSVIYGLLGVFIVVPMMRESFSPR